ncbi:putative forkhead associated domain containing protein [Lyophyllum shimeji]|uniref:Forkhead associated domain containing protein n=1 Tax=Lyophyllum shimeji TaxID=47721 RepID=A0A9P3PJI5_LYOSH|nr:putative forkhead associated domain containing protein [Lyophyllum shimeji]
MDDSNDNLMLNDDGMEETQQQTQSTQQASQQSNPTVDSHLWGYLQPCSPALTRIDFWKIHPRYTIGRNTEQNQIVLPGFKVSNLHCTITWDGSDVGQNVVVHDLSSNGTFINGSKIGRGQTRILREGNEIAFGTSVPQPHNGGLEDYRFIYRHIASGPPTTGLYAFYDLTQELGKGSFATVMKAICRKTGQWFAVKMIQESRNVRSPGEQQPQTRPRNELFMREISILEKLKHPNICELKEVFFQENSNDINLVLELVEGGDLLDYILKNNGLSEASAQHITYQLCDALAYIHSKNVAHRDLKPENVLLTKDNPPIVKVADFGLAKFVDSLTMLRTMCGTPSYLAPEVVRQENNEGYDNLVDSWSVGVIVFSMLTNASPFIEDENQRDIRTRVSERIIDWNCLAATNVSDAAQEFIRDLLEEDPRQRMTLTASLQHPWLTSYTPVYDRSATHSTSSIPTDDYSMLSSVPENENGFQDSVNAGFQNLQIRPSANSSTPTVPGAFPNGSSAAGVNREGSRTAPLQRGSRLLQQAAEDGKPVPEPSWEMIANAAAQEQKEQQQHVAGASNWNAKGQNKRVHSELTPLPEEASMEVMNGASPSNDAGASPDAGSDDDLFKPSTATTGKATRGKAKAAASPVKKSTRARAAKGSAENEDEQVQPRRSSRHPQKVARHA